MGTLKTNWKPNWWNNNHETSWERVREALRRDWEQTKRDLHVGGHELNQDVTDTVAQASGEKSIPDINKLNPPRVIGEWDEVMVPVGYGYAAHDHYGTTHKWDDVEKKLESEWQAAQDATGSKWHEVKDHVRRGFEYRR